jgi:hypothetical protein
MDGSALPAVFSIVYVVRVAVLSYHIRFLESVADYSTDHAQFVHRGSIWKARHINVPISAQ